MVQAVQIMLGDGFKKLTHIFKTNMDIYLLVMAWGLNLGELVNEVRRVMKTLVHKYFLVDMESIPQWVILGVGLVKIEGMDGGGPELADINHLFIKWLEGHTKDWWWERAKCGWKALKIYAELMALEETIENLKEVSKEEMREKKGLRLWKNLKLLKEILPLEMGESSKKNE